MTSSLGANLVYERNEYGELICFKANEAETNARFTSEHRYDSLGFELEPLLPGGVSQRDLFGLAPWGAGEKSFDLWQKKQSKKKTVQKHIASVKRHLRAGGGKHEMFPVSIAMDAKRLGFTPSELRSMTLNTEDVVFHYRTYRGKHHKSTASSLFHQDLIAQLKVAKTKTEALRIIEDMHEKHVVGYKSKK